jgi:cellulase/cellobiase CelA1
MPLRKAYTNQFNSDTAAKVPTMGTYLADIQSKNAAGASPPIAGIFVVYDLPDRDCAALASNGEYTIANNGVANYKAYIDSIRAQLVKYSNVHTILVVGKNPKLLPTHQSTMLTLTRARQSRQPGYQPERGQVR